MLGYQARLSSEIEMIKRMGFTGYFLIVWDFIRYARENGIPVGPGRGSAAGSLVAYRLEITDVDPLQYDLLFERFLNPDRVSMPDIDIDFCVRGRGEVINHVTDLYGRESSARSSRSEPWLRTRSSRTSAGRSSCPSPTSKRRKDDPAAGSGTQCQHWSGT